MDLSKLDGPLRDDVAACTDRSAKNVAVIIQLSSEGYADDALLQSAGVTAVRASDGAYRAVVSVDQLCALCARDWVSMIEKNIQHRKA